MIYLKVHDATIWWQLYMLMYNLINNSICIVSFISVDGSIDAVDFYHLFLHVLLSWCLGSLTKSVLSILCQGSLIQGLYFIMSLCSIMMLLPLWTFGLYVGLISVLTPWYLNFWFNCWSSQFLDALVLKSQFNHWSNQSTDALVPKLSVFY